MNHQQHDTIERSKPMKTNDTIQAAIALFKSKLPLAKGKFRTALSESNRNEVDFFSEDGLYCSIDVRNGKIKGI